MARTYQDALDIMRLAIGRRNENDPDSDDNHLLGYLNDFMTLTMSDDVKLFEQFGTIEFTIDETNTSGVYEFPGVDTSLDFVNISNEALISLLDPINNSVSWNILDVYQDPGEFYMYWGINNDETLIPGFPTQMLYYGNQFVFRTIPNTEYLVKIYGYKKNQDVASDTTSDLPFDYWLRYSAYGAAMNYARDYKFDSENKAQIQADFNHERKLLLTRTHNQIKIQRAFPRF